MAGKTFPVFPAHAVPVIFHLWQEVNGNHCGKKLLWPCGTGVKIILENPLSSQEDMKFLRYFLYLVMFMYIYITQVFLTIFLSGNPFKLSTCIPRKRDIDSLSVLKAAELYITPKENRGQTMQPNYMVYTWWFRLKWTKLEYIIYPHTSIFLRWRNFRRCFRRNCVSKIKVFVYMLISDYICEKPSWLLLMYHYSK